MDEKLIDKSTLNDESNLKEFEATEFYFETDFYLLKNNNDYKNLIESLAILEVQKCSTIKNIEKLAVLKDQLSKDPSTTLKNILKFKGVDLFKCEAVHELPVIDWSAYKTHDENEQSKLDMEMCDLNLRNKNISDQPKTCAADAKELEDKPESFKKPWSVDEQLRLEELLIEHPPERNESNRYRKISEALGTRTLRQVCSRVQKYNLKMKKVGSIKPSAKPSTINKKTVFLTHKNTGAMLKPTTFIPSTTLTDDVDVYDANTFDTNKYHKNIRMDKQIQLEILNEVLQDKLSKNSVSLKHNGFKCCVCELSPIVGIRWNCSDCPSIGKDSDFCNDCIVDTVRNVLENPPHPLNHTVVPIKSTKENEHNGMNCGLVDPNYAPLVFKSENYLDPNYMV